MSASRARRANRAKRSKQRKRAARAPLAEHAARADAAPSSPEHDVEARWSGVAGIVAVLLMFAALVASAAGTHPATASGVSAAQRLHDAHRHVTTQTLALALWVAGLALVIPVGRFLLGAASRRGVPSHRLVRVLTALAPALLALAVIGGFFALRHVADQFAAGPVHSGDRAKALIDHSGSLRAATIAEIAARIVFGAWVVGLARVALRAELLTTFLGYFGMGAGVATMIPGLTVGDALLAGWIGSVAILALGWWPGGRPPAWSRAGAVRTPGEVLRR